MNISQYPFNGESPRRVVLVGKKQGGKLKAELIRLSGIAERKRISLRSEITPPIQSDEERGKGDSTNARLHRILHG